MYVNYSVIKIVIVEKLSVDQSVDQVINRCRSRLNAKIKLAENE